MNSPSDLSIRPTTAAELPALAHVTSREERRKQELPRPPGKKEKDEHGKTPPEARDAGPAGDEGDEPTGTINVLA